MLIFSGGEIAVGISDEEIMRYALALARTRAPITLEIASANYEIIIDRGTSAVRVLNFTTKELGAVLAREASPLSGFEYTFWHKVVGTRLVLTWLGSLLVFDYPHTKEEADSGKAVFASRSFRIDDTSANDVLRTIEMVARRYAELEEELEAGKTVVLPAWRTALRAGNGIIAVARGEEILDLADKIAGTPTVAQLLSENASIYIDVKDDFDKEIWLAPYRRAPPLTYCCRAVWEAPMITLKISLDAGHCELYERHLLLLSANIREAIEGMAKKLTENGSSGIEVETEPPNYYVAAWRWLDKSSCAGLTELFRGAGRR